MAVEAERLIINLEARLNKFDKDMRKAAGISQKQFGAIERQAAKTQKKLSGFSLGGAIGKGVGVLAAGYLGVQGAREVAAYAAAYVDIQNSLKVTGLEGKALADVFKQLTQISMQQGAPLDALVTLYSRASGSAKELGASQGDLIKFSDGIATALRVAGTSATEAQGALLQLSQALGGGTVQFEEYGSLLDGGRPILQAVASGLKEAGGSVSTLTALVKDQKISSEAFFRAFIAGSGELRKQAALTAPTVSQSMERIKTSLTVLFGELDKTVGASNAAAKALDAVADVIQDLPDYIKAAGESFDALVRHLDALDKHSFFGTLRDALRYDPNDLTTGFTGIAPGATDRLRIRPGGRTGPNSEPNRFRTVGGAGFASTGVNAGAGTRGSAAVVDYRGVKVAAEAITTAGTSATAMAGASGGATVSIKDFAVAAEGAAGKLSAIDTEIASVTGGAVGDYVKNVIGAESGGDNNAKNPDSTATGAGQFIESTWLALFRKNFPEIAKGRADSDILALRKDRAYSEKLIEAYAKENSAVLTRAGVSVNEAALHLSHFLGAGDAAKVLKAAPGTPLAGLISQASINANPTILGGGRTVDDAKAYANKRATGSRQAAGNYTPAEEAAKEQVKSYQDLVAGSVQYIAAQQAEAAALGQTSLEASKLRHEQELLNQASQAGLEITPQLKAQISELATGMAQAEIAAEGLATTQRLTADQLDSFRDGAKDVLGGFISDLREGKSASEALGNALASIADKLLDSGINSLIDSLFGASGSTGTGIFGSLFSALGFASGGYTGAGSRNTPAGIVHKGEYVVPKHVVDKVGLGNIQRMYGGYAAGGFVSGVPMRAPTMRSAQASQPSGPMTIAVDVTGANGDKQIQAMVQQGVRAGIGQYDKQLNRTIGNKVAQSQARG